MSRPVFALAHYTRNLIRTAIELHAASLRRVQRKADAKAEQAHRDADDQQQVYEWSKQVLEGVRHETDAAWRKAHHLSDVADRVSEAVAEELAQLGKLSD